MNALTIPVTIDPKNLRTFRHLDRALEDLQRQVIDQAANAERPVTIMLSFEQKPLSGCGT